MKRIKYGSFCITIMGFLLCAVLSACGGGPTPVSTQAVPVSAQPDSAQTVSTQAASASNDLDAAIREASDYLNKQLSKGDKLLILNVQSEFSALSEYIIDELIANAVNDRIFTVVDRQQLNVIRAELGFQMSGEVDDATAQALGRMAGAQIIISGAVSMIGDLYRLRVRALSVQSAQIEGQFNRNISSNSTIAALVKSKATGYASNTTPSTSSGLAITQSTTLSTQVMDGAVTPQGNNLSQQLAWIANQGGDGTVYNIIVNNDIAMRPTTVSTRGRNITIIIRSENSSSPRVIELSGQGSLFSVESNIILILQDIILKGRSNNNGALVFIETGGKVILNSGSKVTGNTNISNTASGGGIHVDKGILEINDGAEISGNTVRGSDNVDPHRDGFGAWDAHGGGIFAGNRSIITIKGGLITDNKSDTRGGAYGGGIFIIGGSTVSMTGGIISRNSCTVGYSGYRNGGGVFIWDADSSFTKKAVPGSNSSGIIYGASGGNANTATDGGHAIFRYFANPKQCNTTLGNDDEISTTSNIGW
ncbi:hypothetical protein FACS189450_14230 [Spirochaetia bacterium]|nr:hypothetical protein FACS189450_14230 [Spirochaetia bacterium]